MLWPLCRIRVLSGIKSPPPLQQTMVCVGNLTSSSWLKIREAPGPTDIGNCGLDPRSERATVPFHNREAHFPWQVCQKKKKSWCDNCDHQESTSDSLWLCLSRGDNPYQNAVEGLYSFLLNWMQTDEVIFTREWETAQRDSTPRLCAVQRHLCHNINSADLSTRVWAWGIHSPWLFLEWTATEIHRLWSRILFGQYSVEDRIRSYT